MGYGFGYGPPRSPAVLLLRPVVPSPFALPYLSAHWLDGTLVNTSQHQERVIFATKWSSWESLKISMRTE
jgi:hypothetical protein